MYRPMKSFFFFLVKNEFPSWSTVHWSINSRLVFAVVIVVLDHNNGLTVLVPFTTYM